MSLLKILTYPNSKLRRTSAKVRPEKNLNDLQKLVGKMFEAMKFYKGVGLAAPQVGVALRIVVIDLEEQRFTMMNPEIVHKEGTFESPEACLSIPQGHGFVQRNSKIKVKFLDREGQQQEMLAEGLLAACIQHEVDHLDGILFIDRVSALKREMIVKRLKKLGIGRIDYSSIRPKRRPLTAAN